MPCRYVIDKEQQLVITTAWGDVTFDEAKAHQDQLISDPDFRPEFNQLINATAVTDLVIVADEAKMLARRTVFSPTSRRAFLATEPFVYGMGRLMETYCEMAAAGNARVFSNRDSALKWLGFEILPDAGRVEEEKIDRSLMNSMTKPE